MTKKQEKRRNEMYEMNMKDFLEKANQLEGESKKYFEFYKFDLAMNLGGMGRQNILEVFTLKELLHFLTNENCFHLIQSTLNVFEKMFEELDN